MSQLRNSSGSLSASGTGSLFLWLNEPAEEFLWLTLSQRDRESFPLAEFHWTKTFAISRTQAMATSAQGTAPADQSTSPDAVCPLPGQGKSWGKFVTWNTGQDKISHPFACAKAGCSHRYSKSNANATRVGRHIAGGASDAKGCMYATVEDKTTFPKFYQPKQCPVALSSSQHSALSQQSHAESAVNAPTPSTNSALLVN